MTFSQRSKLHLSIADFYESNAGIIPSELTRVKLIAYHLVQVIDIVKDSPLETILRTTNKLTIAGEFAARNGDTNEAFIWWNHALYLLQNNLSDGQIKRENQKVIQFKMVGIGLNVDKNVSSFKSVLEQAKALPEICDEEVKHENCCDNYNLANVFLTLRNYTKQYQDL